MTVVIKGGEGGMEFRLTFEGPLLAHNGGRAKNNPARNEYRHSVRQIYHRQLKTLWNVVPHLREGRSPSEEDLWDSREPVPKYDIATLAAKFEKHGWNFVPLVTKELRLTCWIDIMYLRRQEPGEIFSNGDTDNRLKTLFDCLTLPDANQGYQRILPDHEERPFFCLLEDDKLISKISVETDNLLENINDKIDQNDARLIITIRLRPYEINLRNIQFA